MSSRILHLLFTGSVGGAEKTAINIIKNVPDTYAIYVSLDGEIRKELDYNAINYELLSKITIGSIKEIIEKHKINIIHAHDFRASILASFFYGKVKIISHIHQNPEWLTKMSMKSFIYYLASFRINEVVCVSNTVKKSFFFKALRTRFVVIYNLVPEIESVTSEVAPKYDIGFVGRLEKIKGAEEFLSIVEMLQDAKVSAIMVGSGSLEEALSIRNQEKLLGVEFTGFSKHIADEYAKIRILVVSSISEGFGIAAIEAMALGIPVVYRNLPVLEEVIGVNGGVAFKDEREASKKILEILGNEQAYKMLSENAIEWAGKFMDPSINRKEWEKIYGE